MSWTFFLKNNTLNSKHSDARHFCVIAGDNITDLIAVFKANRNCKKEKIILTFPGAPEPSQMRNVFWIAWNFGITDIVIVSDDLLCRVFTYFPIKAPRCFNMSPFLMASWKRNSTCKNESFVFFPRKILSLSSCELNVIIHNSSWYYWRTFVEYLEVAMNSTFVTSYVKLSYDNSLRPSTLRVFVWLPYTYLTNLYVLPSYFYSIEYAYAVPRVLVTSVDWFRLFSELSYQVWIGLSIALIAVIGTFYYFMKGGGDLAYAVLFSVQPLLGTSWELRGNLLSLHGRVLFTSWLFFCLIVSSSYLCTLLSLLTVSFTSGAINTFEGLVRSELPVHAALLNSSVKHFEAGPYFKPIKKKLVLIDPRSQFQMVQKHRQDIVYHIVKDNFVWLFANMSYKLLPRAVRTMDYVLLVLSKPTPYEEVFKVAVLRTMGAGALDKVTRENKIRELLFSRRQHWEEMGPYALPLKSFRALFVVWLIGCALSLAAFVFELVAPSCDQFRVKILLHLDAIEFPLL